MGVKPANLSTNSKRPSDLWNKNETNCRLLSKKLNPLSNLKNPRSFDCKSRWLKPSKILIDDSLKRKKKSTTLDETVNELWNLCKPLWTLNPSLELKLSDKRRSWNLTLTIWKSNSVTPTDLLLMPPSNSRPSNNN